MFEKYSGRKIHIIRCLKRYEGKGKYDPHVSVLLNGDAVNWDKNYRIMGLVVWKESGLEFFPQFPYRPYYCNSPLHAYIFD